MRGLARFVACGVIATAFFVAPGHAWAAASAHLVYVRGAGAEECPGEPAVRAAVSARLGYDPFFAWARDTVFAEITRTAGGFRVDLKLVDDRNMLRGARQITVAGNDCAAAIDAMGLTMSLAIDPSSLVSPPPARPVAPAASTPETHPETPPANATVSREEGGPRPRSSSVSLSGHVGLGAVGTVGTAPMATVGAVLFAGMSWHSLSLDVEGRADLPASGAAQTTSARVQSWLVVASVVPCVHLGAPFGCLVVSGGSLGATSAGTSAPRTDHAPWWGAGLRAGAEVALPGALSLRAYAELLAALNRDLLSIDGAVAYRFAPWSGGLGAELAWRFP